MAAATAASNQTYFLEHMRFLQSELENHQKKFTNALQKENQYRESNPPAAAQWRNYAIWLMGRINPLLAEIKIKRDAQTIATRQQSQEEVHARHLQQKQQGSHYFQCEIFDIENVEIPALEFAIGIRKAEVLQSNQPFPWMLQETKRLDTFLQIQLNALNTTKCNYLANLLRLKNIN